MAAMWSLLALVMVFMTSPSSLALTTHELNLPTSTISATPAYLPDPPLSSSPTLSPDITPLFPSPGKEPLSPSPTESSLPTIPSTPSTNPDDMLAPAPESAFSPSGSLPASSAVSTNLYGPQNLAVLVGLLAFLLIQVSGM